MKPELPEMIDTYTEWSKMVKIQVLKEYRCMEDSILSLTPDFESIEVGELSTLKAGEDKTEVGKGKVPYSEEYHLDGVDSKIKAIYQTIISQMMEFKSGLRVNPQKYYISIVAKRNFAYIRLRKMKVKIVIMLPEDIVRAKVKHHNVATLSEGVRRFYGGDCCRVLIENDSNLDEVIETLKLAADKYL